MALDQNKVNAFMGNFVHDLGVVFHAATIVVGDKLGLYKGLAEKQAFALAVEGSPAFIPGAFDVGVAVF